MYILASLTMAARIAFGKLGAVKAAMMNLSFDLFHERLTECVDV